MKYLRDLRQLVVVISLSALSCATKHPIQREADETVVVRNSRQLRPFSVDPENSFPVRDEGRVIIDLDKQPKKVASDVNLNGDTLHTIRFARAEFHQDTLMITLFELNESSDNFYKIIVVGGKYIAHYDFSTPMDRKNRTIRTIASRLILNTNKFKEGQIIRGHTEFEGKCNRECWYNPLTLAGNFAVKIE